jgi:arginyl-tRNA--protein-N-Asp/Glu arginylyltransferase
MEDWQELNLRGVRLYETGDAEEAYDLFKRAYELSPRIAALAYNAGMAAYATERRDEGRCFLNAYQSLLERACPYFMEKDRASCESLPLKNLGPEDFDGLLERGFRRTGRTMSRNVCPDCAECVQMRVVIASFRPSRSQRRILKRNADIRVEAGMEPSPHPGKARLLGRYLVTRHDWVDRDFGDELAECYEPWTGTREFRYYLGDDLAMASITDSGENHIYVSTCFFEPSLEKRSLGIFNLLTVIQWARERGLSRLYAGECIVSRPNMAYKRLFRPHEILGGDGRWREAREARAGS